MLNSFQKTIKILLLSFLLFSIKSEIILAQNASSDNQFAQISIQFSPTSPKAGDTVNMELSGYGFDLDSAKITWYVDGIAKKEGLGFKTMTIQAKSSGQSTKIKATAETPTGSIEEATIDITSGGVDLILEPQSYVPIFYKGKSMFVNQGTIKAVAIPDVVVGGKKVDSRNLIFKWQKDGITLTQNSGAGKDSFTVTGSVPVRDINVGVAVFNLSGVQVASASRTIVANDPKILFYEDSPLYGILFNKAITGNYYLGEKEELNIIAKPYFFDFGSDSGSDSTYRWSVNGTAVPASGKLNELLLRQTTENLKGTASISLSVTNVMRIFQFADNNFSVSFGI